MDELITILVNNPDLPVLSVLIIFVITRVNTLDRKVAAICSKLQVLEKLVLDLVEDGKHGKNTGSEFKISKREER